MSVRVSSGRREAGAAETPGAAGPAARDALDAWVDEYAARFGARNSREWRDAYASLCRDLAARRGGDPAARWAMVVRLRREVGPGGRLEFAPEAHLVLAQALADCGDVAGARSALWRALRLAGGRDERGLIPQARYDRERASAINFHAAVLFGEMGDGYQMRARHAIARYFAAADAHRVGRLGVHSAPPKIIGQELSTSRPPAMGPPGPNVPVPEVLTRGPAPKRPDVVPPSMEGRPHLSMGAIELLNQVGQHVVAHRRMAAWGRYLAACEEAARARDFLPTPPKPEEVLGIRRDVERAARFGTPEQRACAQRILDEVDFGFLEESSRAYWAVQ